MKMQRYEIKKLCRIDVDVKHATAVGRLLFGFGNTLADEGFNPVGIEFSIDFQPYFLVVPQLNAAHQWKFGPQDNQFVVCFQIFCELPCCPFHRFNVFMFYHHLNQPVKWRVAEQFSFFHQRMKRCVIVLA